jgi:hypothetical protein
MGPAGAAGTGAVIEILRRAIKKLQDEAKG